MARLVKRISRRLHDCRLGDEQQTSGRQRNVVALLSPCDELCFNGTEEHKGGQCKPVFLSCFPL